MGPQLHVTVSKLDRELTRDHHEELVGVWMGVPHELALELGHLDVVIVDARQPVRLPVLQDRAESRVEVAHFMSHGCNVTASGGTRQNQGMLAMATYSGPPELTLHRVFTSFAFDPLAAVLIVGLGASYLLGVRKIKASGGSWSPGRTWCFMGLGLGTLAICTMCWVGVYAHAVFWVYAVQIIILLTATPLALALGGPISLALATLPARPVRTIQAALRSLVAKIVTFPILSSLLLATFPFLIYFTGWYESTLRNYGSYELLHLVLLVVGFVFVWPLAGVDEVPRRLPYAGLMVIALMELLFDAFPGIVVRLKTHLIAPTYYNGLGRPWGHSLLADQRLGGGVLWFAGEIAALPLMAIMGLQWIRSDKAESDIADRELEEAFIATATVDDDGEFVQPWWETDPDRLGSRASRYQRKTDS